jgi:hypothetical protein
MSRVLKRKRRKFEKREMILLHLLSALGPTMNSIGLMMDASVRSKLRRRFSRKIFAEWGLSVMNVNKTKLIIQM